MILYIYCTVYIYIKFRGPPEGRRGGRGRGGGGEALSWVNIGIKGVGRGLAETREAARCTQCAGGCVQVNTLFLDSVNTGYCVKEAVYR